MRGRTNAEPNIGVQLNATIDSYEVATGETILAGDFVDRFTKTEGGTTASNNNIFQLSDGKYLIGTSIFEDNGNHTFTNYGSTGISVIPRFQINTDEFVSFDFSISSGNEYYYVDLVKYDSTNNYCVTRRLQFYQSNASAFEKSSIYAIQISAKEYVIFVSFIGKNTSQNKYGNLWRFYKINLSGTNYSDYTLERSLIGGESNITSSSKPTHLCTGWAIPIQSNDYLIGVYQTNTPEQMTYSSGLSTIMRIKGSSSATIKRISSTDNMRPLGTVTADGYIGFIEFITGKLYQRYLYVDKSDINTYNLYNAELLTELQDYSSNSYKFVPLKVDNDASGYDRYIIVQSVSNTYVSTAEVYVNLTDREITVGEVTLLSSSANTVYSMDFSFIFKRGSNDYLIIENSKLLEASVNNHVVVGQINTNQYVRGIRSQDYALGVAKQSGTSGDTIQVYVPTVNS